MAVAFDAVGPSSAGTLFTTSPGTWTHVNGGNGILIGVTTFTGTSNVVTGVTYGGVTIPLLGFVRSANDVVGGVALYGLVGPTCPTGSNTVSVAVSDANNHNVGSVSVSGAGSLGTPVTNFSAGAAAGISASVTGTTSGGLVVSVVCQGSGNAFTATAPNVKQLSIQTTANSGSDNLAMGTDPSTGGTVAPAWTIVSTDFWGIVAVEVLPPAGGSSPAGKMMYGPGWHPGRGLPGMPGGTPFYSPAKSGIVAPAGVTSSADTSLAVTAGITADSVRVVSVDASLAITASITADAVSGAGSSRQWVNQPGVRPRWAALLRNKQRRGRYFTVPATGLKTADTSLTVTAGITADSARTVAVDTSLAVTAGITDSVIRVVSVDTSLSVTAGITADSSAGGESTRQVIEPSGSRPKWAALLRTKQRRNRYFTVPFASSTFSVSASLAATDTITAAALNTAAAAATETVTAGVTAAVTETASASSSLTVTAGITAAAARTQPADASLTVTVGLSAAATLTLTLAASVAETAGITASASSLYRVSASTAVTAGISATASVGIAASLPLTAGITAAASETAAAGASSSAAAGITASAAVTISTGTSADASAGITAAAQITYTASTSLAISAGITGNASGSYAGSAAVALSAGITATASVPSEITARITIEWNIDVITVPSSTLLTTHWKSMTGNTRLAPKDGVKYMTNDTRGAVKDGVKYMTNGGYK